MEFECNTNTIFERPLKQENLTTTVAATMFTTTVAATMFTTTVAVFVRFKAQKQSQKNKTEKW